MRVRAFALAALVAAAPALAVAAPDETPDWSIGAGLGFVGFTTLVTPAPAFPNGPIFLSSFDTAIPVATFFVERRVGERTWLVFGGSGSVQRQSVDAPPFATTALTRDDAETISASVGLRRVVTRPGAIVDVSLVAALEGGYVHSQQVFTTVPTGTESVIAKGGYAAVTGGLAVERELTGGLAVRISTPLLGASWSRVERSDNAGSRTATSTNVFATLAPRLELRLAF